MTSKKRNLPIQTKKNEKLMLLKEFAIKGLYSAPYLYGLARAKKIRVKKIKTRYYTTEEWFIDFLKKQMDQANNKKTKKITKKNHCRNSAKKIAKNETNKLSRILEKHLTDEIKTTENAIDIDEQLAMEWQNKFKNDIKNTIKKQKKQYRELIKNFNLTDFSHHRTIFLNNKKFELTKRSWPIKPIATCLITLILAIAIGCLIPKQANELVKTIDGLITYPFTKINSVITQDIKSNIQPINKPIITKAMMLNYIINNQNKLTTDTSGKTRTIKVNTEELRGRVAGAVEQTKIKSTVNNRSKLTEFNKQKNKFLISKVNNFFKNIFDKLADEQKRLSLDLDNKLKILISQSN